MIISAKKKKRLVSSDNPIEAVRNLAADVTQGATDMVGGVAESAFQQIFGTKSAPSSLSPNEEINFENLDQNQDRRAEIHAYQRQREQIERDVFSRRESDEVAIKIQELQRELKKLVASSNNLAQDIQIAVAEPMPVDPGKYQLHFLEWLLMLVKSLREKVDESQTWLSAFSSKKQQKQYWSMFKKHGTSFGLSNERVVSTQTG